MKIQDKPELQVNAARRRFYLRGALRLHADLQRELLNVCGRLDGAGFLEESEQEVILWPERKAQTD